MSKRFFPQQHGERKKAKLDITISDHNFPLSQNSAANNADNWGDDNEDELLLMASQACEQVYGTNSTLPDFSLCMQPAATSTQLFPQPGPSQSPFQFKKPSTNPPQVTSTQLKDKCNRISSPLPGISSKISPGVTSMNYKDDLIYNDKVCKGQDADYIYKQLLQLQEENAKLKSENGKLLDKCVTKEGEASILRTQLKTCQVAVDNARMEKVRAQEKVQMEWTEKLSAVTGQMQDLRTQLDFKNLEIISIKEKCRMLESSKVKLTQVTVPNSVISSSHCQNNSTYNPNMSQRRVKMTSIAVQTDGKAHFLRLYKEHISGSSKLTALMPLILEPTSDQPCLLDYNENLQAKTESLHSCRVFNTFHRMPATPAVSKHKTECKITMGCVHEDFSCIADGVCVEEKFDKIVNATLAVLGEARGRLQSLCERAGAPFQREMDERYIEAAGAYVRAPRRCLLAGRALYKEEQEILARRMVALLAHLIESSRRTVSMEQIKPRIDHMKNGLLQMISEICNLLDAASCATLYSGLIYSISILLSLLPTPLCTVILKSVISCRPMAFTLEGILGVLRRLAREGVDICARGGNMRIDFEQGVLLYKKESCHLHVFLKQVEVALQCVGKQKLAEEALSITQNLLAFYSNYNARNNTEQENTRCDCQLVILQVITLALRTCSVLAEEKSTCSDVTSRLRSACRSGILVLHRCAARDLEFAAQLGHAEGLFQEYCERSRGKQPSEIFDNMLLELAATFQCAVEETPPSYHRQAWVKSFESFSLAD